MTYLLESSDATMCPECNGKLVELAGEVTCAMCGLVIREQAQNWPSDWDDGASDPCSHSRRCHEPLKSFGSYIIADRTPTRNSERLSAVNMWTKGPDYCQMSRAVRLAEDLANGLGVAEISRDAALFLFEAIRPKIRHKRMKTTALLGAAFIIASRRFNTGKKISAQDVRNVLSSMGFCTRPRHILESLNMYKEIGLYKASTAPIECVDDIFCRIDWMNIVGEMPHEERYKFLEELRLNAKRILSNPELRQVSSDPRALASCAIYTAWRSCEKSAMATRRRISHAFLARVSGLAEYTIRENYERHFRPILLSSRGQF